MTCVPRTFCEPAPVASLPERSEEPAKSSARPRVKEPSFVFFVTCIVFLLSSVTLPRGNGVLGERHEAGVLAGVVLTARVDRSDDVEALFGGELDPLVFRVHRPAVGHGAVRRLHVQLLD